MATRNPDIPIGTDGKLYKANGEVICAVGPRTGWYDWLERPKTKSFQYHAASGATCTVIKEWRKSPRTGNIYYYWYAHRRIGGKLRRRSLGPSDKVSLARLEQKTNELAQLTLISQPLPKAT